MKIPEKQVIVIRKDLNVSLGKMIAQAVHSSQRSGKVLDYSADRMPLCIVTYVKSEAELLRLRDKCEETETVYGLQKDGGKTEIELNTITALSIGPDSTEKVDKITKRLRTVKAKIIWET